MERTRTIVVANGKGGVGKTTSAVAMAAVAVARGGWEHAVVIDGDTQASAARWLESSPIECVEVVEAPSGRLMRRALELDVDDDTLLLVDTPGHDDEVVAVALEGADAVVVPTRPGIIEVPRVAAMLRLVPSGTPHGVVVVAARAGTVALAETLAGWSDAGEQIWGVVPERVALASREIPLGIELAYAAVLDAALARQGATR